MSRLRTLAWAGVVVACGCGRSDGKDSAGAAAPHSHETGRTLRPPVAPVVRIQPDAPTTLDALSYVVDRPASDPDGDSLTWHSAWYVDGRAADGWTDTVPSDATTKGEVWELRVVVTDGVLSSETALDVVVIGNTPPEATVTIEPAVATTLDALRAVPSGTDIDGDTYGFQLRWTVDGIDAGITAPDVPAERTSAGETWAVTVTPVDPEGAGPPVEARVAIENSVPVVRDVRIVPSRPGTAEPVGATFTAEDADTTDVLTPLYAWSVNGVQVSTDDTLDPALFVRDDTIGLGLRMSDGTVEGPTRYADAVVVDNTPPSITDATLDPPVPAPDDDVACLPTGWTDPDGDSQGYQYAWTLDGQPGPSTDHWHLSTLDLVGGETLTCAVTPDDGLDAGATIQVSAAVASP